MHVIDGAVVNKGRVVVLSPEGGEEPKVRDRAFGVHISGQTDGFAGVHALKTRHRFGVVLQRIGKTLQPVDALVHGRGRPHRACVHGRFRCDVNIGGR